MIVDLDLYGVFLPSLFAWMIAAFVISLPVRWIIGWFGLYRFVWHRPLFDFSLYVVLLGAVVATAKRLFL
jgi:hypothetical protein